LQIYCLYIEQVEQTVLTGHNRDKVMSNAFNSESDPGQLLIYQIRIKGHLGREWADWFEGLAIRLEDNGDTLLTGLVLDQAALYGVRRSVRDVGMPLLSVFCVKPGQAEASEVKQEMNDQIKSNLEETHESTTWGSDRAT
jgi:hypothetical protein